MFSDYQVKKCIMIWSYVLFKIVHHYIPLFIKEFCINVWFFWHYIDTYYWNWKILLYTCFLYNNTKENKFEIVIIECIIDWQWISNITQCLIFLSFTNSAKLNIEYILLPVNDQILDHSKICHKTGPVNKQVIINLGNPGVNNSTYLWNEFVQVCCVCTSPWFLFE